MVLGSLMVSTELGIEPGLSGELDIRSLLGLPSSEQLLNFEDFEYSSILTRFLNLELFCCFRNRPVSGVGFGFTWTDPGLGFAFVSFRCFGEN